ncbi:hypothetical protein BH11PLA2_BH11PLA2_18960 [soil metagenome]
MSLNLSKIMTRQWTRSLRPRPTRKVHSLRTHLETLETRALPTGDIQVLMWHDTNGNGIKESGEDGIPGRTAYLDINHSGSLDAGDISQVSDSNGDIFFAALAPGMYTVVDLLPSGWAPSAGTSSVQDVLLIDTEQPQVDMGSYQPQVGTINGSVWNDLNGDGLHTAGEPGLVNWRVYLDINTNGAFDAGEPSRLTTATGAYSFAPVSSGVYNVAEVVPAGGWLASPGFSISKTVTVPLASVITANFSNYVPTPGTVTGKVYQDANNNGNIGGSDPGVSGITVYVDLNHNGALDGGEPTAVTGATGSYTISGIPGGGTQTVREILPLGWTPASGWDTFKDVTLNYGTTVTNNFLNVFTTPASIGGTVWNDANADSLHTTGETGQSGVTVFIDANVNGTLDAGETFTATNANGVFSLGAVLPASYTVVEVLPSGWKASPGFTTSQTMTVAAGVGSVIAFSNYLPALGSLAGTVWSDLDNNGLRGAGEPGITGWQVYLDLNTDGALTAGEPTMLTDGAGAYAFTGLALGTYSVREFTKSAWMPTNPTTGARSVTVLNGQAVTGADFGNYAPQNSTISGTVFFDKNSDGVRNLDEPGISGVTVYLDLNNNAIKDVGEPAITSSTDLYYTPAVDETGNYSFVHQAPGIYHVREIVPIEQSATPAAVTDQLVTIVSVEDHAGVNFANVYRANEIHGVIFDDLDGDHIHDAGEAGIAGSTVYVDTNRNHVRDAGEPEAVTGADGSYTFTGLTPGSYVVHQESPSDSVGTYPTTVAGTLWPTGVSNPAIGDVTPTSITQSLTTGQTYNTTVSLTLPLTGSITNMVDVFLLFDDTGSFTSNSPIVQAAFPAIISSLQASMPGIDLGFGVGRFEEYGNFAAEYATGRPFILNQPIIASGTPGFSAAIQSGLSRTTPGYGGDQPETLIEALYQTVSGAGFDGNNNGTTTESGAAGVVATQLTPGNSGDVPAFSTFSTPVGSPVLPAAGNRGGAGFRAGALPIILAATDTGFAFQPKR